ncbi:MAG TPA: lipase maturation factor family protein [Polyangiales bacterium]|nr:lipase maturation factor family protein [Polyangiales bacterium]
MLTVLQPELIWGLIPRCMGLLYVLAFSSLIPQLEAGIGSRGVLPAGARFDAIARDFPGLRRFTQYPSVLWLNRSDTFIRLIPWLGTLCGIVMFYGGPLAPWALALAWLLWLSIEPAALIFPWDTMLQEAGFLAFFLPGVPALPVWEASQLPDPTVAFMVRWLAIRLMLGFGKVKFVGANKSDRMYMRGFFVWMPLPTPLGWFMHHAPRFVLRGMLMFMFVAEVIAPLLGLFSGPLRLVSFAILASLMIGIHLTGNWAFFNIGYLVLCLSLLDTQASIFDWAKEPWHSTLWQWPTVASNAALLVIFITSVFYLVFADSWVGRTFMFLDLDRWVWNRAWARAIIKYFRAIAPFRIVNGYGVFHPHADPPLRVQPVFEGSNDGGVTWRDYRYHYLPTRPTDRLAFAAPHHPRFDIAMYYAGLASNDASFFGAYVGDGAPYTSWARSSALDRGMQRLLQNDPLILKGFRENPFPDAPPDLVRVGAVALTPTTNARRRATGEWWHVRRLGVLVPARGRETWSERQALPVPELFHPDWTHFKRQAPALQTIVRAYQNGMPPDQAIIQGSDLTHQDVHAFWHTFIPALSVDRADFSRHRERADAMVAQFGMDGLLKNERILERFVWLLRSRTERYHYADSQPTIPIESTFRFHLFLHEIVGDGRDAYLALLEHPENAAARVASSSDERQLWALTLCRHDIVMYHVCVFRWLKMLADAHELKVPGIFEYMPVLLSMVPPSEVYRPQPHKRPDGEHEIAGLYPPPDEPSAIPVTS